MKSKFGLTLFFGLFFAAGTGFFAFTTIPMLTKWHAAKTWEKKPAQLISQELKTIHGDDSTTYQVIAEYRYEVYGMNYTNTQVAVADGSDNIGSFQQDLANTLKNIASNGGDFTVWVNPEDPAESLIDRKLRMPLLLLQSVFLLIFGGVGAGGVIFSLRASKEHKDLSNGDTNTPWLNKKEWSSPTKNSTAKSGSTAIGLFAMAWSVVSVAPLVIGIQEIQEGNALAVIALLFPLSGLGLIYYWYKLKKNIKATGDMPLTLDPYPGSIGGQLGGTIKLKHKNPGQLVSCEVIVDCLETYKTGNETDTQSIWQNNMVPVTQATAHGMDISFSFDIPEDLPESQTAEVTPYKKWKLNLELIFLDDFEVKREYIDLPVFKTPEQSRFLSPQALFSNSTATAQAASAAVDKIMDIREENRGYRLFSPAGQQKGVLGLSLFGLVFIGIGLAIPDLIFNIIFPTVGGLITISGIYFFANSLDVRIGDEGITSIRRLLGVTIRRRFIPSFSFKAFREKKTHRTSSSTGSTSKHTQHYCVIAHGRNGEKAVVVENLKSLGEAHLAIEKLNQLQSYSHPNDLIGSGSKQ